MRPAAVPRARQKCFLLRFRQSPLWYCLYSGPVSFQKRKNPHVIPGTMNLEESPQLQIVDHKPILPPIRSSDLRHLTEALLFRLPKPGSSWGGLKKSLFLKNDSHRGKKARTVISKIHSCVLRIFHSPQISRRESGIKTSGSDSMHSGKCSP